MAIESTQFSWLALCRHAALLLLALAGACQSTPSASGAQDRSERQVRGNLLTQNIPELPAETLARVEQYGNSRSAALLGFVGDEMLISTRFAQTNQVHRVAAPLASRKQLTFFKEPVASVTLPPVAQPPGYIYGRDVGGSEFYQLFWFDFATGSSRMLSDGESRYGNVLFSADGQRFAYSTTERDGSHHDVHLNDLQGNRQVVYESTEGWWAPVDFSADGAHLLLIKYLSINESELHEADLAAGTVTQLLPQQSPMSIRTARYADAERNILFAADLGSQFVGLHQLERSSDTAVALAGTAQWDVEALALAKTSDRLAYVANVDGLSELRVYNSVADLVAGKALPLPEMPAGIIADLQFHRDGNALGLTLYSPTAPGEVYVMDLAEGVAQRWTDSEIGGLNRAQFVAPELIRYPTFDQQDGQQRQIPAFYYRPQRATGPTPVLVLIHGGPEAQFRPYFSATVQFLANELGIAIIAPNVRGSAGYGKDYLQLDNGFQREDSVKDIGALLDWIADQQTLDAQRVAVYGGSYGGYMVLAALTNYAERLAAGIEIVGISNFVTFLENTQPYRQDLRRVEYGDERDPKMRAFLEQISPLNRVAQMRAPLMISQGANDPRVPASESEQIVAALAQRDVPVWYLLANDEGHGFRKQRNRNYNLAAMALFLRAHLLRDEPVDAAQSPAAATTGR